MRKLQLIKEIAEDEAYDYFSDNIRPLPQTPEGLWDFASGKFVNNDVDAFRHAYVSGVFTQKFGDLIANSLGQLNELEGDLKRNQSPEEKNMDLWNNEIGRKYGQLTNSKKELAQLLEKALNKNELITTPDQKLDPRIYQEPDYTDRINPNKPVVVLEESSTGRNKLFLDLLQGAVMTLDTFIKKINSGSYPGYSITNINDVFAPISKPDKTITNNLG